MYRLATMHSVTPSQTDGQTVRLSQTDNIFMLIADLTAWSTIGCKGHESRARRENRALPLLISIRVKIHYVRFPGHSTAFLYTSATIQNAEIRLALYTLIFTAVGLNHGDNRKSRHTTKITVKVTVIVNTLLS